MPVSPPLSGPKSINNFLWQERAIMSQAVVGSVAVLHETCQGARPLQKRALPRSLETPCPCVALLILPPDNPSIRHAYRGQLSSGQRYGVRSGGGRGDQFSTHTSSLMLRPYAMTCLHGMHGHTFHSMLRYPNHPLKGSAVTEKPTGALGGPQWSKA